MAAIGTIRKHSTFLVIIIGIGLFGFLFGASDVENIKNWFRKASVDEELFNYQDLDKKYNELYSNLLVLNKDLKLNAEDEHFLKNEAWKNLVHNYLLKKEYDALGLTVSIDELKHLVGPIPEQSPEENNRLMVVLSLFEQYRYKSKYYSLVRNGYYMPKAFAQKIYTDDNKSLDLNYVLLPYKSIPDESIKLNEKDIEKAYNKHKQEFYENEAFCNLEYVIFDVLPSKKDRDTFNEELKEIVEKFATLKIVGRDSTDADTLYSFASYHTVDYFVDTVFKKQDQFPLAIDSALFSNPIGTLIGPVEEDYVFYTARVLEIQTRPDSVKFHPILIPYKGSPNVPADITRTAEEAEAIADSLIAVLKKQPEKFAEIAATMPENVYKEIKVEDLEAQWKITEGVVDPELNEACFTGKTGEIKKVDMSIGFFVINIMEQINPVKKAKVVIIKKELIPSNDTRDDVLNIVSKFVDENKNADKIDEALVKIGKPKRMAEKVKQYEYSFGAIPYSRNIIQWAFDEKTKVNQVSNYFEYNNQFVVAILKYRQEKGIPKLDEIKDKMEAIALKIKKEEMLTEKINAALASSTTLEQLSAALGVTVENNPQIKFQSPNLHAIGPEPKVVGAAFGLEQNVISKPIAGNNGVFVIKVGNLIDAPVADDYSFYQSMLQNKFYQRANFNEQFQPNYKFPHTPDGIEKALEKVFNVNDNRKMLF